MEKEQERRPRGTEPGIAVPEGRDYVLQQVSGPSAASHSGTLINNWLPCDEAPFLSAACGCIFLHKCLERTPERLQTSPADG